MILTVPSFRLNNILHLVMKFSFVFDTILYEFQMTCHILISRIVHLYKSLIKSEVMEVDVT